MKKSPSPHTQPAARSAPPDVDVSKSVRATVEAVAGVRQELRRGGIDLADILERGETLREFAHSNHRY